MGLQPFEEAPSDANPDKKFVFLENPTSGRVAIVEEDEKSCWLYLTDDDGEAPVVSVLLYNVVECPTFEDSLAWQEEGQQPPLPNEYGSVDSIQGSKETKSFQLAWSDTDEAVLFSLDNQPWALIEIEELLAYSRAFDESCPFGNAWDQGAYLEYFAELEFI